MNGWTWTVPTPESPRRLEDLPDLLTEQEAAAYFGVADSTLRNWRRKGIITDYLRLGPSDRGPVRYDHECLRKIQEKARVTGAEG